MLWGEQAEPNTELKTMDGRINDTRDKRIRPLEMGRVKNNRIQIGENMDFYTRYSVA
jgi:hypothetical protein